MRKLIVVGVVALVAAAFPLQPAASQTDAQVTFVHAVTYNATETFEITLCVDGVPVDPNWELGDVTGPESYEPGTIEVVIEEFNSDCTEGNTPELVELNAGDDVTVMVYWDGGPGAVAVFPNDTSCVEPGEARVTARHGADWADDPRVNVLATPEGGSQVELFADLDLGAEASADVDAGTYDLELEAVDAGQVVDPIILPIPDVDLAEGTSTVVYVMGGNDGAIGYFTHVVDLEVCEQPTTTTTTTIATTTTTEPAPAVAAVPAFTG